MNKTIVRAIVAGLAAGLLVGSSALAQSKATKKSLDGVNAVIKEMTKGREQVQGALDALDALNKPGANLSKEYEKFTKNVASMAKTKDRVSARVEDMNSRRDAYLKEWHKQSESVSDPEIQALMESRREEVKRILDSSKPTRDAARDAFGPFLSSLQDIDKMLSVDLSPTGVQAAATITQSAVSNGTSVLAGLDAFLGSLTQIRDQLSPKT
jgi:septal ring factor EnvC (AmiA/AmiB activator)